MTVEIPEPELEPVSEPEPEPHSTIQSEAMRVLEQDQGLPQFDGGLGLERVCADTSSPATDTPEGAIAPTTIPADEENIGDLAGILVGQSSLRIGDRPKAEEIPLPLHQRSDGSYIVLSNDVPVTPSPQASRSSVITQFKEGDRVMTPDGQGEVLRFNPDFGEYSVGFEATTGYYKPEDLTLLEE